jgi:hypothetical protein
MAKQRINDEERRLWVENDEGLYNMMQESGLGMKRFIRENRKAIDKVINNVTSGKRQAHYLIYG